ncbi:porin family protein [Pontibacter burrus]|uniref:PorT family protein n=1 Tax=Pontibacter burrus TaxID=2704466 RepID=A0A6B3LVX8_9BACT|nr:porin family protein [Pontibacter burrus]NEM98038.1 PorT family protein [Pontibacter burrus]
MKQLYITLLLVLAGTATFAQSDFRPGFLVQNGDTISGLIDYRGAQRNTKVVTFKTTEKADQQNLAPEQVQSFGFKKENKIYESKLIPAFDTLNVPQVLFAEILVRGQANLFFLRDPMQKDRFYISKGSEALEELKVEEFKQKNMQEGRKLGHLMLMRRELYKPVLMRTFLDCNSIKEADIDKVVIGHNSLTAIVRKYNQCVGQIEYAKPQQKIRTSVALLAGFSSSSLSFTLDGKEQLFNNNSLKPIAGASFNFSMPTFSEKISMQIETLFTTNYFEGNTGDDPLTPGNNAGEYYIDVKHFKIPTMLRYTLPSGTFRPYIQIGPVMNFVVSEENEAKTSITFGGSTRTTTKPLLEEDDFRNFAIGLTGGVGISYPLFGKMFSLEARYEANNGVSHFNYHSTRMQSYSLLLSYKL